MASRDARPLIAHVMYRFDVGGLENGVVNLINHMPPDAYRHVIIALTEITDFRQRIRRDDVEFIALNKRPGHALWNYPRLFRLFRKLRPSIIHTRNLAALELVVPAWAAGVPVRIHGEHGRDVGDLDGSNRKYQWVRRFYRPFVTYYIALSRDLEDYLTDTVGMARTEVAQIYNGVDAERFFPAARREQIRDCPFTGEDLWLVGTVGRMQTVKNQTDLAKAFIAALRMAPELKSAMRLVMVGDGPLRAASLALLEQAGCADLAWLPGERGDVPEILRGLDCFALPSLAEGISNTILEAMASGLPVVATDVGGNRELIEEGMTGTLVSSGDVQAMAREIVALARNRERAQDMGRAGRLAVERKYSMAAMVRQYQGLYDHCLAARAR
ncbi:TIGR03088 family PEP-CTERM/XrtA system glycosyltransferase [Propionivibrio sp.]|uniref:TIGR03088 family PEP-CTERM/XrtA system glycosyltransferase n=1 Tax=Propionivibrio sp. TaxID=2212460 RepID=UPI0039E6FC97